MKPSGYCDRVIDGMEGTGPFTLLARHSSDCLTTRHSERKQATEPPVAAFRQRISLVGLKPHPAHLGSDIHFGPAGGRASLGR